MDDFCTSDKLFMCWLFACKHGSVVWIVSSPHYLHTWFSGINCLTNSLSRSCMYAYVRTLDPSHITASALKSRHYLNVSLSTNIMHVLCWFLLCPLPLTPSALKSRHYLNVWFCTDIMHALCLFVVCSLTPSVLKPRPYLNVCQGII